jgi:cell fate (sporulation/competence/biofilm development) regulator YmcA (YheA/YmcA/DUF963 family)
MNNKIEELFNTIENTKEYIEYKEIKELLINDEEIMNLIKEIKKLQKKATHEEASHQTIYKLIQEKINNLNSYSLYHEFITKKENLNDILAFVTNTINKYLEDIINKTN